MSERTVLRDTSGRVAVLTVSRPDKRNALDRRVLTEILEALDAVSGDAAVAAVVLTGAGDKAFVAGADIGEMAGMSPEEAHGFSRLGGAVARAIDEMGKPVIAAVNGYALGGGCELALACHLRLAAPTAVFGQPEVSLGLIPGFGGTQRLARLVGEGRALEMLLSGGRIDAAEAQRIGLVNRVIDDRPVREAAVELGAEIARQGPVAVRFVLRAVRRGLTLPLDGALELESSLFGLCFATEDMKEGTRAFLERRRAAFRGA